MTPNSTPHQSTLHKWEKRSFLVGGFAGAICVLGAFLSPDHFFRAYLAAYQFWLGLALGSLAIVMIYHLTGGAWGYLIRRILEAQMSTLPLLAILFIPLMFGLSYLYLWSRPDVVQEYESFRKMKFYLNDAFYLLRAPIYFGVWLAIMYRLKRLTRSQSQTGDKALPHKLQRLSEVGLVLFGTVLHFAAFDWFQSLQPHFHSTIFALLIASTQLLTAHAFAIFLMGVFSQKFDTYETTSTRVLVDLGNLLLSFLVIAAYMMWFQFMLIWIANLSYGALWFLPRIRGGWGVVIGLLIVGEFFLPLFLLLIKRIKSNPAWLASIAGVIFVMQLILSYWLIMPAFPAGTLVDHWMDLVTPFAIGGLNLGWCFRQLRQAELVVLNDPNRNRAVVLRNLDRQELEREEALAHG